VVRRRSPGCPDRPRRELMKALDGTDVSDPRIDEQEDGADEDT
jgi:hypothetical protein